MFYSSIDLKIMSYVLVASHSNPTFLLIIKLIYTSKEDLNLLIPIFSQDKFMYLSWLSWGNIFFNNKIC